METTTSTVGARESCGSLPAWLSTWERLRRTGWETLLMDSYEDTLSVLLADLEEGARLELTVTSKHWEVDCEAPSERGIGEAIWAQTLVAEALPGLVWDPHKERRVLGKGVFLFPLGPVHADVAESLQYRLQVMGDDILYAGIQNQWKRRYARALCRRKPLETAATVTERITTTSTVAHALAFSLAVESALELSVSPMAASLRLLFAEIERSVSHLGDLAALAASTGLTVPQMEYLHHKEALLRSNHELFGHRYLRGLIRPGGVRLAEAEVPGEGAIATAKSRVMTVLDGVCRMREDLLHTTSFLDRLHGAGVIPPATREFVRPVGPVGRAADRRWDVRTAAPYSGYEVYDLHIPHHSAGDAFSRFLVKAEELEQSLALVRRVMSLVEPRAYRDPSLLARLRPPSEAGIRWGFAWVEAPRGLMCYRVGLAETLEVEHVGLATPSQRNWYAVPPAFANHNILQDFPIIDASFNLSVAGWDA